MSLSKEDIVRKHVTLLKHHIQCILKSGVILDEDMDIILTYYHAEDVEVKKQSGSMLKKVLGVCSVASVMYMLQKKYSVLYNILAASPVLMIGLKHLRDEHYRKKRMQNLETAVTSVKNISKLNRMILEYFRARRINDPSTAIIVNPYTRGMRRLIETIAEEEVILVCHFSILVRQFGSFVPSISNDYAHLEHLEYTDFFPPDIESVNDAFLYLQRLCDVYILLASNCLTCLALVLSPKVLSQNDVDIDEVLNRAVPKLKSMSLTCYNRINQRFDDVKYYYLNRSQDRNNIKIPRPSAAGRLQMSAYNTMIYTSEILEKSKIIYDKLQEVDLQNLLEKERLAKCVYELRCQVFDYYESLDILHKLFQVNINASQGRSPSSNLQVPRVRNSDSDIRVEDASLNAVEPSEDEEYELFVGANDTSSSDTTAYSYFEEESRRFASLLGNELKQKLRRHARFIAARERRGIIDEPPEEVSEVVDDDDEAPPVIIHVDAPPAMIQPEVDNEEVAVGEEEEQHQQGQENRLPPPPPPPLPPIDFGPFADNHGAEYTVGDFLDAIMLASRSRTSVEEVFGGGSDEESDN